MNATHQSHATRMEIGIATTGDEMEAIHRLRYECYVEELGWKYEGADGDSRRLSDPMDASSTIYFARSEGRMIATYSLHFAGACELPEKWQRHYALDKFAEFPDSSFSFSSRLMVLPNWRGSMVVPRILMRACEDAWKHRTRFNFCYCRPRLVDLYERLGFLRFKDNIVDPAQGYMVPMVLLNEDAEHFRAVGSPFLKMCLAHAPCSETARWFDRTFHGWRDLSTRQLLTPDNVWQQWSKVMREGNIPLLRDLDAGQVRSLLSSGTVLHCREGDTLLREGEAGHEMFLILEGSVNITKQSEDGVDTLLGVLGQGEVFGEIAMMSRTKRTASVKAASDLQVLVISQEFIQRAMRALPEIAMRLLYNLNGILCEKLKKTTADWLEAMALAVLV